MTAADRDIQKWRKVAAELAAEAEAGYGCSRCEPAGEVDGRPFLVCTERCDEDGGPKVTFLADDDTATILAALKAEPAETEG